MKYDKGTFVVVPNIKELKGQMSIVQGLFTWLCVYANEDGECFPSRSTLAKNLKVTPKTIDRSLNTLIDLGMLIKKTRKDGVKNLTNIYQIMIVDRSQGRDMSTLGVGTSQHQGRDTTTPGVGTPGAQELYPIITQSNEHIYTSSFNSFWSEYPIKIGKKTALASWLRLKPNSDLLDKIITDVHKRIKFDNSWKTGYIQHPTTYLNQERWEDEDMVKEPIGKVPSGPYKKGKYEDDVSKVVSN